MKDLVLYHGGCYDGFGAAYSAWKKLGDNAEYISVVYGKDIPKLDKKYDFIYICDFSYNEEQLLKLLENANYIRVLDHHKTAEEMLTPLIGKYTNINILFDMNRSGALITWQYFHGEQTSQLIKFISDRDLWAFKLENTKAVHAALKSYSMDFNLWDNFNLDELIKEGNVLLKNEQQTVNNILKNTFFINFEEMKVPVVNTSVSWSEVGEALWKNNNVKFAMSFTDLGDKIMFSLRSAPDFDCTNIAKKYGGGGHKNASGFKINRDMAYKILNNI